MELEVIEDSGSRFVADIKGASHTLCNALKNELWNNESVKVATYMIRHPLTGVPRFTVETEGNAKARKALADAAARLADTASKLKKEFKKVK
ncbi:DNA-directed RNA polymerase subunit L [Candidatus Woesearchaeota archaeon]|nr:DNA-directed RNA polymerase subunit L [Candidatus Woesearchaeota archaeon]